MKNLAMLLALAAATPATAQTLAVTNAEAWTLESDTPVKDATILIEDGRIKSVTPGGAVPEGATVIELGRTTEAYELCAYDETVDLAELQETWEHGIENVFPYRTSEEERAAAPAVEPVPVARYRWLEQSLDFSVASDVDRLDAMLAEIGGNDVVALRLAGRVDLRQRREIRLILRDLAQHGVDESARGASAVRAAELHGLADSGVVGYLVQK